MVAPPLELGAVKAMLALALPAVAVPMVGAPGTVTAPTAPSAKPAMARKRSTDQICSKPKTAFFIVLP